MDDAKLQEGEMLRTVIARIPDDQFIRVGAASGFLFCGPKRDFKLDIVGIDAACRMNAQELHRGACERAAQQAEAAGRKSPKEVPFTWVPIWERRVLKCFLCDDGDTAIIFEGTESGKHYDRYEYARSVRRSYGPEPEKYTAPPEDFVPLAAEMYRQAIRDYGASLKGKPKDPKKGTPDLRGVEQFLLEGGILGYEEMGEYAVNQARKKHGLAPVRAGDSGRDKKAKDADYKAALKRAAEHIEDQSYGCPCYAGYKTRWDDLCRWCTNRDVGSDQLEYDQYRSVDCWMTQFME